MGKKINQIKRIASAIIARPKPDMQHREKFATSWEKKLEKKTRGDRHSSAGSLQPLGPPGAERVPAAVIIVLVQPAQK